MYKVTFNFIVEEHRFGHLGLGSLVCPWLKLLTFIVYFILGKVNASLGSFSSQFMLQVAERALFLWNNDHIRTLISQNRSVILPIIFEALEKNIQSHWNQAVHGLTVNVRKMLLEMDVQLFEECQRQYAEEEAKVREIEDRRELTWQRLDAAAARGG